MALVGGAFRVSFWFYVVALRPRLRMLAGAAPQTVCLPSPVYSGIPWYATVLPWYHGIQGDEESVPK